MVKQLHTVKEVISELGGQDAVKQLTNSKSASRVPMWKNRKRFPATTYTVLKSALQERGLSAPDDLWGMQ
ncbi:hypothetical protein V1290_000024 [Bradyrhizobium sp. AZCC 1578]|uniref:hypothetical protein n=1 Tax=Bradyrhizobium sp. AZCC 1578 TaxID=3117027 RepID=UPI002FF00ACD